MMTVVFAALRTVAARVPGMVWVALFVGLFLVASAVGLLHHGERIGEGKVHARALADSTVHQRAAVDTATRKSDSVMRVATKAAHGSTVGRAHTRAVLEAARDSTPPTVIQVVSEQLARDSTTIAVQGAAIDTLVSERGVRIQLDTLTAHQLVFKPPGGDGLSVGALVQDAGVVVLIVEVVRLLLQLVRK